MLMMPDMENSIEARIVVGIVTNAARDKDAFAMALILLVLYGIARFIIELLIYLFRVYRERAFTPSPHMRNFRILLGAGLVVLVVSFLLGFIFIGFALFSVASAAYDWYTGRSEKKEAPEIEELNLKDMVAMQRLVNKAYDDGLMARR
jgi:hypothetical protein